MGREGKLLSNREMLPDAQKKALERWEVVDDFRWGGGFLLSNGEILEGLMGEHMQIAYEILPDESEPLLAFLATGAIKMKGGIPQLGLCMELVKVPTLEQIQTLRRFLPQYGQLNIDVTAINGKNIKSISGFMLGSLLNNVREIIQAH